MEARLIDQEFGQGTALSAGNDSASGTLRRVDRYLLAAGIATPCRRELIARTVFRELHVRDGAAAAWPEIIAAAEPVLLAELPAATPQRGLSHMAAQDLSPWKPHAGLLLPALLSRSVRNVTACLGWLATVFIP